MKVLLCGGSGLVGRTIMKVFKHHMIDIIGTYNKNKMDDLIQIDFLNLNELETKILEINPDICISNIAERQNEICENNWNLTKQTNIDIPHNISYVCNKLNIFMIHISTDYVYDGQLPPFNPLSNTNPLQNYGISKLIAEKRIIGNFKDKNFLIIRIPVLYSNQLTHLAESAVTLIIKKVMNKVETFKEDNFSIRRPVFIEDFSIFLLKICKERKYTNIHCFYNPYDCYTKYEIAKLGSKILNTHIDNIIPINNKPLYDNALRPKDTQLFDNEWNEYLFKNTTLLENGLRKSLEKYIHPKLTGHNTNQLFLLLDLDGTLVDSEIIQWKSYNYALNKYNINYTYAEFSKICHSTNIKSHLLSLPQLSNDDIDTIMILKTKNMKTYTHEIQLVKGVSKLLNLIQKYNINHCVVTNSSIDTVNLYKDTISELNILKNWITRQDYNKAKPSSECYQLALNKYKNNEKYIIGFENSYNGIKSLLGVTNIVYGIIDINNVYYNDIVKKDIYIINNFDDIIR